MDLRKLVLVTSTVLGSGFVLVNIALSILLAYQISQFSISSSSQVSLMFGTLLFLLASIVIIILGGFLILGGIYFYRWGAPEGIISLGILMGSLYLLFLGIGSAILHPSIESMLLILGAVFFMIGNAAYMSTAFDFKLMGSFTTLAGGILVATVLFNYSIFGTVFAGWDIPFLGPFMSMSFIEGIVLILAPAAIFTDLLIKKRKEKATSQIFFPIVTLIYGMGMFIGTLFLTLSLWNLLWKAPWLGPLHDVPYWVFQATIFWSVTLIILAIAGVFLGASSFLAFVNASRTVSVEEGFSQLLPSPKFRRRFRKEESTTDKYASLRALISSSPTKTGHPYTGKRKEEDEARKGF